MPRKKIEKADAGEKREAKLEKLSDSEFEKKVLELAETGLTSEKIGEVLRKSGIHPKDYGKKISQILKEKNKYVIPEVKNIENKLSGIVKHYEKNHQDKRAMREKDRIFSQLRKMKNYFGIPVK
ncbi:MAG TPA: hypothetical protein VJ208_00610 [Candidatus Nanoarchaeia archaeon]|nr:hypothetical protein [Candidatus Nanoarchaeia archaeon]